MVREAGNEKPQFVVGDGDMKMDGCVAMMEVMQAWW